MKNSLLVLLVVFLFTACGYKPSSHYAKRQLEGSVFVNLIINLEDPRNAVIIKDAMHELIVHRLDSNLVFDKKLADTILDVKLNSVGMQELQDDEDGYNNLYRAVVTILVSYHKDGAKKSFTVSGDYEFSINKGSTITDSKRFEAIRNAATKALEEVISKLAVQSFEKKK
ncbi:LPS assembly lipoprotein LptE [Halarcobacter bivalviorum]|uniref:LPS assembly lipoprotein LptE n=1 Tax=Halarcobacter bivalviorum TaxID=663364 RepID=UPI00100BDE7F|nr:LPS assembly lipoprotein LptE [Halarcobacter bivalviorum]RXK03363.1 hypothetical protein CRU97_12645 [Halarcobacter bivalviorum]